MIFWFSVIAVAINVVKCETNLLTNGDFEDQPFTEWFCNGPCNLASSTNARGGSFSVNVTGRTKTWHGLTQYVNVTAGQRYSITAYVQLQDTANNAPYQTVSIKEKCTVEGSPVNKRVAMTPYMVAGKWYEVGGVRKIAAGSVNCKYYVQTDSPSGYLVDDASVKHIPASEYAEWESNKEARIEEIRKATLSIELIVGPLAEQNTTLDIELKQKKMEFFMGSAVSATHIVDPAYKKYQDVFYEYFEWAVLENALKWRPMEAQEGNINEDRPMDAMNSLISNGIKMRCHSVLWGVENKNPDWVQLLSGADLESAVDTRVNGVVNLTKGLCKEWDVNNEMLHGDFYESNTGNPNFTADMFHDVHNADEKSQLCLNDYGVINGPDVTVAMKNTALKYKAANVPIGGIGAQSHMKDADVDAQLVKERLDRLAEAGIPIVITEFSVKEQDENVKAQKLTDLMWVFFSHHAVEGVLLWGFWDGKIFEPDAALFTGENVIANAAGRAYQDLFKSTWRTNEFQTLNGNTTYHTKGFKGDYLLQVKYGDDVLATHTFTLSDDGEYIEIFVEESQDQTPVVTIQNTT